MNSTVIAPASPETASVQVLLRCSDCHQDYPADTYTKSKDTRGYSYYCKGCLTIRTKRRNDWYAATANAEREEIRAKRWAEQVERRYWNDHLKTPLQSRMIKLLTGHERADTFLGLLGCSLVELRQHIASQFEPGMSWDNHSNQGWHLDHIAPVSFFDFSNPIHQRVCFHYSNLRPMWAELNSAKGDRLVPEAKAILRQAGILSPPASCAPCRPFAGWLK